MDSSMDRSWTTMNCPWTPINHHGLSIDRSWAIHGLTVDHAGLSMEPPLTFHRPTMDPPWTTMHCPWNHPKLSMNYGRRSTVHRPSSTTMDCLWTLHGLSMDPLWTTMDSLWNHDFLIEPTWAQHGPPWTGPGTIMDRPRKIYGTIH